MKQRVLLARMLVFLAGIVSIGSAWAQITVQISPVFSAVQPMTQGRSPNPRMRVFEYKRAGPEETRRLKSYTGKIAVAIMPQEAATNPRAVPLFTQQVEPGTWTILPMYSVPTIIVLIGKEPKDLDAVVLNTVTKLSEDQREKLLRMFSVIPDVIQNAYKVPAFTVDVKPCGHSNAYSAPDVVICTELVADFLRKKRNYGILAVQAHELAHSLLNVWGLPGADNEDMADQAAVVLLAKKVEPAIRELQDWLKEEDSVNAAVRQIVEGDTHAIPIQRVRNMEDALSRRDELEKRWERMIVGYKKKRTSTSRDR